MVSDQPVSLSSRERRNVIAAAAVVLLVFLIGFGPL
jgi:hypothetical protein